MGNDRVQVTGGPEEMMALVEALHKQNTDHDKHGYAKWKEGCPTCDLLMKFGVASVLSAVVCKPEGPVRGG